MTITNKTSFGLLLAILMLLLTIVAITVTTHAQTPAKLIKPVGSGAVVTAPAEEKLTPQEISERDALFKEFQPIQQKINEFFAKFLEAEDDQSVLLTWAKAKRENDKLQAVRAKFMTWFAGIQKAHNCPGCELRDTILVKPAAPAPAQVPAPKP